MKNTRRGFSLIEMVMVLAVSGLMVSFLLKNPHPKVSNPDCYVTTKAQLTYIRQKVEQFARANERLPLPAKRYVDPNSPYYGREVTLGGDVTQNAGVSFGALPFQALGLPSSYAGDCWGNKYTYAVTTALTTSSSSGGYKDTSVDGNITLLGDGGNTVNSKIAYAIISHGEDALGAVKLGYSNSSAPPDTSWCSGSTNIAYTNCKASAATLQEGKLNDGKNAGANYFDDVVVAGGKPQTLTTTSYISMWGDDDYGQLGDSIGLGDVYSAVPKLIYGGLTFTSLYGYINNYCGLTVSGDAYCWGDNTYGQIGIGVSSAVPVAQPTAVGGGLKFTTLAVGSAHVCGLIAGGAAYCWGDNTYGQLGDGTNNQNMLPTPVTGGLAFTSISSQGTTICGIAGGVSYCWGSNGNGQIGDNTTNDRNSPTPVLGPGGGPALTFTVINQTSSSTCGLIADGTAYCWGDNSLGELGNGGYVNSLTPTPVTVGALRFNKLGGGWMDNCGITAGGAAYCWGSDKIGDGTTATRPTPTAVSGGLTFNNIVSGYKATSCGVDTNGNAYCWGNNQYGMVGDGTITSRLVPTAVLGGRTFTNIAPGQYNTCGLTTGGQVYCWGWARGYSADKLYYPNYTPVTQKSYQNFTDVTSGQYFSCGLTVDGAAYCSGNNALGQLGNGNIYNSISAPTAVVGPGGGAPLKFTSISAGFRHVCALTAGGTAYCWGYNANGQIGDNTTTTPRTSPTAVLGPGGGAALTFKSITSGSSHTCGLTTSGAAYCWGVNNSGQIGDNTIITPRKTPTAVLGPGGGAALTFTSIAAGANHTCGLTATGTAYCWGLNNQGQIGDNTTTTPRKTPTAVLGPGGGAALAFTSISAGYLHTCGLIAGGYSYCWGYNGNGQTGDNTNTTPRTTPTAAVGPGVDPAPTFTSIDAGYHTTCASTSAGSEYCWGYNNHGQLGIGSVNDSWTPALVTGTGTPIFNVTQPRPCKFTTCYNNYAAATTSVTCTIPNTSYTVPPNWFGILYQSATPTGACVPEYRECSAAGVLSGSYTQQTCTPGCDGRTVSWTVGAKTCAGPMPAQAGGGNVPVNSTNGNNGSVTASCSALGVITLSNPSCS